METVRMARVVIMVSPDGEAGWKPLDPLEVPTWLQNPNVLGHMLEGNLAHDDSDEANPWYVALRVPDKPEGEDGAIERRIIVPDRTPIKASQPIATAEAHPVAGE